MRWSRRRRDAAGAAEVATLVTDHLGAGDPTGWFEPVYARAARDPAAVPWAGLAPHPSVVDWLAAPVAPIPGSRAVVVGCGLGDEAALLADRGFAVTAFDVAPTAVAWAAERFADRGVRWEVADLLDLPDGYLGAFDLVVEVRTVQSLPGVVREAAMHAIGTLVAPGGVAVTIGLLATSADAQAAVSGPPWPQAPAELAAYRAAGLARVALDHPAAAGPVVEVRVTWVRGPSPQQAPATDAFGIG